MLIIIYILSCLRILYYRLKTLFPTQLDVVSESKEWNKTDECNGDKYQPQQAEQEGQPIANNYSHH